MYVRVLSWWDFGVMLYVLGSVVLAVLGAVVGVSKFYGVADWVN